MNDLEKKILERMQNIIKTKKRTNNAQAAKLQMLEQQYAFEVNFKIFDSLEQKEVITATEKKFLNKVINLKDAVSVTMLAKKSKIDIRIVNRMLDVFKAIYFIVEEYDIDKKHKIIKYCATKDIQIFEDALQSLTREKLLKLYENYELKTKLMTKKSIQIQQEQKKNIEQSSVNYTIESNLE